VEITPSLLHLLTHEAQRSKSGGRGTVTSRFSDILKACFGVSDFVLNLGRLNWLFPNWLSGSAPDVVIWERHL